MITTIFVELTMPRVLIGPYLLRNQPGRFRQIFTDAGFEPVDPEGDFSLTTDAASSPPSATSTPCSPAASG